MPKKEREAFVEKLLSEEDFREDLIDAVILRHRENEPSRSLEQHLADRNRRQRQKNRGQKNA